MKYNENPRPIVIGCTRLYNLGVDIHYVRLLPSSEQMYINVSSKPRQ